MKSLLVISLIFTCAAAGAQTDLDSLNKNHCQHTLIHSDDGRTLTNAPLHHNGSMLQRKVIEGRLSYELRTQEKTSVLKDHPGKIRDFVIAKDHLWTVGDQGLRRYSLDGELLSVFAHPQWRKSFQHLPRGLYHHPETSLFYIPSGKSGMVVFSGDESGFLKTEPLNIINEDGHRSAAVAVDGDGRDTLYIAMTATSEKGFDGVLTYDIPSKRILNRAEYKRRAGVVFPYASLFYSEDKVFLNNGGWIHAFHVSDLATDSEVMPKWLAMAHGQGRDRQFVMTAGDLIVQGRDILGCGTHMNLATRKLESRAFSMSHL